MLKLFLLSLFERVLFKKRLARVDVLRRCVSTDVEEVHISLHPALVKQFDA